MPRRAEVDAAWALGAKVCNDCMEELTAETYYPMRADGKARFTAPGALCDECWKRDYEQAYEQAPDKQRRKAGGSDR